MYAFQDIPVYDHNDSRNFAEIDAPSTMAVSRRKWGMWVNPFNIALSQAAYRLSLAMEVSTPLVKLAPFMLKYACTWTEISSLWSKVLNVFRGFCLVGLSRCWSLMHGNLHKPVHCWPPSSWPPNDSVIKYSHPIMTVLMGDPQHNECELTYTL